MDKLRNDYSQRIAAEMKRGPARIAYFQRFFQKADGMPVFLKSKTDINLYRGVMGLSLVGLASCFVSMIMMDTGRMKKKQR